jgi:hypothetical protein
MSDYAQQECILESSLYLTDLVLYYARAEKFYITRASDAVASLQEKIIDVYKVILEDSIELRKVLDQRDLGSLLLFSPWILLICSPFNIQPPAFCRWPASEAQKRMRRIA